MIPSPCAQQGCAEPNLEDGLCRGHALARAVRAERAWGWTLRGAAALAAVAALLLVELRPAGDLRAAGLAVIAAAVLGAVGGWLRAGRHVARLGRVSPRPATSGA